MQSFVKSRKGHALNENLLTPKEITQIKKDREIKPQEFVRSEEDDFVFLVRNPETGKRMEAKFPKKTEKGDFQGVFLGFDRTKVASHRIKLSPTPAIIVFRSQTEADQQLLFGFVARFQKGEFKESEFTIAEYSINRFSDDFDRASNNHRRVSEDFRENGIGAAMLRKIEKSAAARGARWLDFILLDEQPETIDHLKKHEYKYSGNGWDGPHMAKKLEKPSLGDDMRIFHKFQINSSGKPLFFSEPIDKGFQ